MVNMFALRFKGTDDIAGFRTENNHEGEFCVAESFVLDRYSDKPWVVTDRRVAVKAAETDTEWFNAGHSSPENQYVGQLEVVELVVL